MAAIRWRWSLGVGAASGLCLVVGAALSHSQETASPKPSPSTVVAPPLLQRMTPFQPIAVDEVSAESNFEPTSGCVVLGDGRVFQGELTELAAGYRVQTKNGSVVLPFAQVRTVASTLPEAYQQLRESYKRPTANDHLDLGSWCLQKQLFEEASAEAQAALALEPSRKEALSLLKKAEAALGRIELPMIPVAPNIVPRPIAGGAVVSTATQVEFSRHIQRLALNKCGNGGCHGASALSAFKLQQGGRSDLNLEAILKYVDPENPEQSPLLVKARTADGPHSGLFRGTSGTEQYARLMNWVVQAAKDQNNLAGLPKRPKERREGGPRYTIRPRSEQPEETASAAPDESVAAQEPQTPEIETVASEEAAPVPRVPRAPRQAPLKSAAIQKLLENQAPDAFDPDEFNRLVHGNVQP
jgi:hypothetical protein